MAPPLIQSAVFPYESAEWAADLYSYKIEGFAYGRINNPTNDIFEKRMALLESAEAGLATSSGMAAIFMVAHHLVEAGEEIVCANRVYGGTYELFHTSMPRMGIKTNWVQEPDKIEAGSERSRRRRSSCTSNLRATRTSSSPTSRRSRSSRARRGSRSWSTTRSARRPSCGRSSSAPTS